MNTYVMLASILLAGILSNNMVLSKFLGICSFLGVSKKTSTAVSMSLAVILVMIISTAVTYPIYYFILRDKYEYLLTVVFILVIAAVVQLLEILMKKFMRPLYLALGIYLPLITTNCAVLGVTLINVQEGYNFIYSLLYGTFSALGFTLAIVLFAGIREFINEKDIPEHFRGFPIALITAGLMAIAFAGFSGFSI